MILYQDEKCKSCGINIPTVGSDLCKYIDFTNLFDSLLICHYFEVSVLPNKDISVMKINISLKSETIDS